jgi:hypothetical protein
MTKTVMKDVNLKPMSHTHGWKPLVLAACCLVLPARLQAAVVYSQDFNAGSSSLDNFTTGGDGGHYTVGVVNGQLQVDTTLGMYIDSHGYAAINTANFASPYSSTLKQNRGLVTWAFNVSNADGVYNNEFFACLASDSADGARYPAHTYQFWGGGSVGNTMFLYQGVNAVITIPDGFGLDTLPTKGSIRITYDPASDLWSVYGSFGSSYVDPTTVTTLLGSGVDGTYTSSSLPYMSLGGQTTGSDFFDNLTVSVVPEPGTWALATLGIAITLGRTCLRRRLY